MSTCETCGFDHQGVGPLCTVEGILKRYLAVNGELIAAKALIADLYAEIDEWRAKVEFREERITNLLLRIVGFENVTETLSQHIDRVAATITPGNPVRFLGIEHLGSRESLGSYEVAA